MKSTKLILAVLLTCSLITNAYYLYNKPIVHDYYLDVDNHKGFDLYDTRDNRHVANWAWNENEQLDGVIEEDNQ